MNFSENKKYIRLPNNHQQEQKEKIMKQPQNIYRIIWTKVLFLKTILLITCHFKKKIIKMPWQYYWQQLHGTFGKGHDTYDSWWFSFRLIVIDNSIEIGIRLVCDNGFI